MIFAFVVRHLRWFAHIPLAPQVFDALLLTWTALFRRQTFAAIMEVEAFVRTLPGVSLCAHRFGGTGFACDGREFAHIHGNGLLDVRLFAEEARAAVASGRANVHHVLGASSWVSFWLRGANDIPAALELLKQGNCAARQPAQDSNATKSREFLR